MYLKSLVLKGFKSFVDRSVISLEPGITVIVGPNGSGKSNISDAVLWVLGEQSAKQLRAQLMEDVIFSGSPERAAVGVAEVDLILDNSCGTLPLEFEEVVITRRMYRSGDSEYLINGAPSLLRDILDILHDSGIGKDTHSIISQGMLSDVLESKPEDRRALIEEAAGILKHKKRKERSSRKIASMDAHLTRVGDIAKEMDRRLRPLEKQARRAQEHDAFATELKQLELQLAVDDLRELQSVWTAADKRDKEADAEVEIVRMRYHEKEAELEKLQKTLQEKGLFVGDLAAQRNRCQFIMGSINSSMLLLEEKGKNMVARTSELRGKVYRSERELRESVDENEDNERELEATAAAYGELTRELAHLNRESEQIRKQRKESDAVYQRLSADVRGKEKAIDDCTLRITKARQQIENNEVQDRLLKNRFSQIDEQYRATQQSLLERRSKLEELETNLTKNRANSELAKLDIDKRVRLLTQRRGELDSVRESHNAIRAEIKGLEEVDRAFESASPALSWVLSHEEEFRGAIRPIAEMFRAPKEFETLLEHLLGADLFGLMTEDVDQAGQIAERLLKEATGKGEISLLPKIAPRGQERGRAKQGKHLIDYLEYDDAMEEAARALLGDVYVVDSIRAGIKAHENDDTSARFVTRDGAVVWPNGKITLGIQVNDTEGVFARKRRQGILEDELKDVTASLAEAEMAVSTAEEALKVAQQDDFELSQNIAMLQGESDSVREAVGRLEQSMTTMTAERDSVAASREKVKEASESAQPLIAELELRKETLAAEVAEVEEQIAAGRDERAMRIESENEIRERISTCKVDIATAQTRTIYLKRRLDTLKVEIRELKKTIDVSRETQASLDVLSRRAEPVYQLLDEINEGVKVWAEKLKDQAALEQTDSANLQDTVEAAKEAVREAKEALEKKIESVSDVRVEKGKVETQVEAAIKSIVEEHGVLLEVALQMEAPKDRKSAEDRVIRLRRMIANIGPVNQVAQQDYEALKKRREYIAEQLADLEGARKALSKIVAAIDRKMRNRFLETFETVDANFQLIFGQLFPGGNAHLSLTDPDNPESTGIEVSAQPPGKQIKKLILMSGGEKSLTALALLFAVYRTRTVPFYILDEVEAALDDTNLRKMVAYLDSMRNETQFILISHQRRTMEMADVLYGVSMQADGVSKVVSQRLERAIAENADDATAEDVQRATAVQGESMVRAAAPARPVSSRIPAALRNTPRKQV